ncbi:hypothetical protein BaRGS_00002779 [Batillaria attramentaria]|uniref:Hydrophobin n=1 Tax=Batillaria attramentaria TaxID=370345 RepID=A0ABD0M2Y1_9CAEN
MQLLQVLTVLSKSPPILSLSKTLITQAAFRTLTVMSKSPPKDDGHHTDHAVVTRFDCLVKVTISTATTKDESPACSVASFDCCDNAVTITDGSHHNGSKQSLQVLTHM